MGFTCWYGGVCVWGGGGGGGGGGIMTNNVRNKHQKRWTFSLRQRGGEGTEHDRENLHPKKSQKIN